MAVRAVLEIIVGRGTVAGAGSRAVEVLAPQQELDGVIAGGDVRFDAARLLQLVGQKLLGDLGGVDLLAGDLDRGVGDHVGDVEIVLRRFVAVLGRHVVDEAFIERPGVDPALPVVDDRVAEAEGFGLHVGNARGDPGLARGLEIGVGRLLDERVDGRLEFARPGERVGVACLGDVGVVLHDGSHIGRLVRHRERAHGAECGSHCGREQCAHGQRPLS